MNITTTRFGKLAIQEEKIIQMPHGILGFPDQKQFIVLEHKKNSPFFWYQSVDDPGLAFVITSPYLFKPDYTIDLEHTIQAMSWNGDEQKNHLKIYVVVNIPKGAPHQMTANLIGPIVVNTKNCQAIQVVITNSPYTHKFPLINP